MPPPMHIVVTTYFAPSRLPASSAWPTSRCAAHAVGVADRDRAAVDVEPVVGNAELVAAVDHLHGKSLVQLPEADVLDLEPGALQQLRHRVDRADAHFVRFAAGDGEATEHPERREAAARGLGRAHHHGGARAVRELARVAGGDHAAGHGRADLRDAVVGGVGSQAFVGLDRDLTRVQRRGLRVHAGHRHRDRRDLVLEVTRGLRGTRALLAACTVLVHRLARDAVALRDDLGGLQHRHVHRRLVRVDPLVHQHVRVHFLLHAGDLLHAAGHVDVALAGEDALRGERNAVEPRGAHAADRQSGDRDRAAGANCGDTRDVGAGRALGHARSP